VLFSCEICTITPAGELHLNIFVTFFITYKIFFKVYKNGNFYGTITSLGALTPPSSCRELEKLDHHLNGLNLFFHKKIKQNVVIFFKET